MSKNENSVGVSIDEHAYRLQMLAYTIREQYRATINHDLSLCLDDYERSYCLSKQLSIYKEKLDSTIWSEHSDKTFVGFATWHVIIGGWEEDSNKAIFSNFAQSWSLNWIIGWLTQQVNEFSQKGYENNVALIMPLRDNEIATEAETADFIEAMMEGFEEDDGSHGEPEEIWYIGTLVSKSNRSSSENSNSSTENESQRTSTSTELFSTPIENTLAINIDPAHQNNLLIALNPYVPPHRLDDLANLLDGKLIDHPIVVNSQQNALAYVFRQAEEAGYIHAEKTQIRNWLCKWFRVYSKGQEKPLSNTTVYDYLTKEDQKPVRSKRIPYNP